MVRFSTGAAMPLSTTSRWQQETPGTRWFRADLHLHTLDDPPRKPPPGLGGERTDPAFLRAYAHRFLDAAVEQGIEVLGLTPHSACIRPGLSATLAIRDAWLNDHRASDGAAYRDLVFAVYPGFEPSFRDGPADLHLLFLFDPRIEGQRYLDAFVGLLKGAPAYDSAGRHLGTVLAVPEAFTQLDNPAAIGRDGYLVIAAHPLEKNGLLVRTPADIARLVGDRVLALELSRSKSLSEGLKTEPRLRFAYSNGRALLHSSDANDLPMPGQAAKDRELGNRFTLLKLGQPTLGALRQALLARDARVRLPFERGDTPESPLRVVADLPESLPLQRPWLRSVAVSGGTAFHRDQVFRFSPDLTCVIGGSMTGKSTLLDGLRLAVGGEATLASVPDAIARGVRDREQKRFRSGNATVELDTPAGDPADLAAHRLREMRFFAQGELKTLSEDAEAIEKLLFHLVPGQSKTLLGERDALRALDADLVRVAATIPMLQGQVGEAEQELQRARNAREAMARFAQSGTGTLPPAQQDRARTADFERAVATQRQQAVALAAELTELAVPVLNDASLQAQAGDTAGAPSLEHSLDQARAGLRQALSALQALEAQAGAVARAAQAALEQRTAQVQAALVAAGGSAADLNQFDGFARAAQHFDSFKAAYDRKRGEQDAAVNRFKTLLNERDEQAKRHRERVSAVCIEVSRRFEGRVVVVPEAEGRKEALENWVRGLRNPGLTRWWNNVGQARATVTAVRAVAHVMRGANPDPVEAARRCADLGMSDTVTESFLVQLQGPKPRLDLEVLRAPDRYCVQWVEAGEAKDLETLSGGRRVAVLLSLLLEADDSTPLVIDQPEDELDNQVLNETIIPALHRLKGRRQVILATHNANLVVNGDADQVIVLEADAEHGRIAVSGAIDEPAVRDAIVRIVDGGERAFQLRRAKYGF